jgi:hypothetical protein
LRQSRIKLAVKESILGIKKLDLNQVPYGLILKIEQVIVLVWGFMYLYTILIAKQRVPNVPA